MSLESCKWVQPFPRARARLAPHDVEYGWAGRWSMFAALSVMPGQKRVFALDVPGIHALVSRKTWMAGSSPAMTNVAI